MYRCASAADLRIDDRRQLVEGELVSVAPGTEELADIVDRLGAVQELHDGADLTAQEAVRGHV